MSSSSLAGSLVVTGRSASAKTPPRWQAAEVIEILEEAPDAVTLRLRLDETDGFLPGQYYNVRLGVLGESRAVQRAYSVGSSPLPDPSVIDLGVREVPGGWSLPAWSAAALSAGASRCAAPTGASPGPATTATRCCWWGPAAGSCPSWP